MVNLNWWPVLVIFFKLSRKIKFLFHVVYLHQWFSVLAAGWYPVGDM